MPERRDPEASSAASSSETARQAALDLLARRSHFESEIERKLARKGFEREHVRSAMERLRRAGLVDDRRAAVELITAKLRRAPQGRRRLRAELLRRGVAAEVIDQALEDALPRDETELASLAASRFQRRRQTADPRALARHLDRMGFGTHDILALAEESQDLPPPDNDDDGC